MQRFERFFDRRRVIPAMDLIQVDVVGAEARQARIDRLKIASRERPEPFGLFGSARLPIGKNTLVASTISSRRANAFNARPTISSEVPSEWVSPCRRS